MSPFLSSHSHLLLKNFGRILFIVVLSMLMFCLFHIYSSESIVPGGADLCKVWKERITFDKKTYKNDTRQWWEWACLLEKEWDKGDEYVCKDKRMVGNYHICFDQPFEVRPPCLVYSFGIDNNFKFDDAMGKIGCDVYSFDPSMGVESYRRSNKVQFLNMGLSTEDKDDFKPLIDGYTMKSKNTWMIRKLSSIRSMLGHRNRPIDVLKIDIESYEWAVMRQVIQDGTIDAVRQLALEWHIFPNEPMRTEFPNMFDTYMKLKDKGFRQFHADEWDRHHNIWYFKTQDDNSLVNVLFDYKKYANLV